MIDRRLKGFPFRSAAAAVLMLFASTQAQAQVAITVGLQELYDDNIFLEDDSRVLPPELSDPENLPEDITPDFLIPIDGEKNDDFITVPSISIAGALPTGRNFDTSLQGSLAALVFADNSDESRVLIDSNFLLKSSDSLLPDPWFFSIGSKLNSQSSDIGVAEGSTARQSQSHTASLSAGVDAWEFAKKWSFSSRYVLTRYDFLDEFVFSSRDDRPFEEEGSDYISNSLQNQFRHSTTKRLTTALSANVGYISFTETDSNDPVEDTSEELDRIGYDADLSATYQVDQPLTVSAHVGFSGAHFPDKAEEPLDPSLPKEDDETQTSLAYGASAVYVPDLGTAIEARIEQSTGTDTDGDRIITRSFSLNGSHQFGDRITLVLGGRFLQFDNGDDLDDSTDRIELTTGLNIALAESLAFSMGYNFADQDGGEDVFTLTSSGDSYTSNRAFIGINGGIVGIEK